MVYAKLHSFIYLSLHRFIIVMSLTYFLLSKISFFHEIIIAENIKIAKKGPFVRIELGPSDVHLNQIFKLLAEIVESGTHDILN